jgi:tubulin-specific chaperone A
MAPSTPLSIATGAVQRLVKEEASYHREQQAQEKRIKQLEAQAQTGDAEEDENREYTLKQEVCFSSLSSILSISRCLQV